MPSGRDRLAAALAARTGANGVAAATSNSLLPHPGTKVRAGATSTDKQGGAATSRAKRGGATTRTPTQGGGVGFLEDGPAGVIKGGAALSFIEGEAEALMSAAEALSVDLIFTDPGIGGDGEGWARGCPAPSVWEAAFRVAKPGAHLAIFSSRKYHHRVVTHCEDAGWEPRDTLLWVYPKGMPMALDIGQAVDKKLGGKGEPYFRTIGAGKGFEKTNPWYGWGTELRPTWEPISILRKPPHGSVADNTLEWGTGAMNIDATRIEGEERDAIATWIPGGQGDAHGLALQKHQAVVGKTSLGRWPADALFSHSDDCGPGGCGDGCAVSDLERRFGDVAKFFYCPKADRREKDVGLAPKENALKGVKPVAVCSWVIDLLLPPGGLLLDPFCGSGSIGLGAIRLDGTSVRTSRGAEGSSTSRYVGIDSDPYALGLARRRAEAYVKNP